MPTLNDLFEKFGSALATDDHSQSTGDAVVPDEHRAVSGDGVTKIASGGDGMNTLQDIYLNLVQQDMDKTAAVAANVPPPATDAEPDFAKMAAELADAEASSIINAEVDDEQQIMKVASEYDAAGRIMARGFYDEFNKLAQGMETTVSPNQNTETESSASTPSLGDRGLPTVPTNYAGSDKHDQPIETTGAGPKDVYKDSLKPTKTISAGQGTGDDPEAAAISLGGGSPAGFATVRDLAGGKPA